MTEHANSEDIFYSVHLFSKESQNTLISTQQHLALINLVKEDEMDVKNNVISQHLQLVVNIAKRYSEHKVEFIDLVRVGIQGLIHALETFEREGSFRFRDYARQCVRRSIEFAILNYPLALTNRIS